VYLWSPRGRLAIAAASGIFIADRRLRHLTRVAPKGAYDPVFSPDGAELAFVKNLPELATYRPDAAYFGLHDSAIYLARSDGGGWRRLTRGHNYDQAPAWSPTGHWISFSRDESLWIAPAGNGKPYRVPNQPVCCVGDDGGAPPVSNAISTWVP